MEPITREEYYLAKIAGTYEGNTPEPVTIEEYYLATMAGDYSGNTPQPVTRLQYYMAKVAGVWGGSIPAPVTRLEYYWAAIASGEGKVFPPVTREEHFLVLVADAYSVVLTVVTGNPPSWKIQGESWAGIPYPLRQINAGEHDWGAVNIIKRFLWSNNSKRSNKNPNWNFGMETRRNLQRGCNNLSLFFADFS